MFVSGCLLRCLYCHNPIPGISRTARASFERAERGLGLCRGAARHGRWADDIGRRAADAGAFHQAALAAAKGMGLTRRWTPPASSAREPTTTTSAMSISCCSTSNPGTPQHTAGTGQDVRPTLQFAERLATLGKPVWVRFVLVPDLTDDPANVEGIARFVAPMRTSNGSRSSRFIRWAPSNGRPWV